MPPLSLEEITDILLKSAQIGSELCIAERSRCSLSFKPWDKTANLRVALASRIVTSADLAVQESVLKYLLDCGLQDFAIEAEEDTPFIRQFRGGSDAAKIFIDPIDGTLAYSLGCAHWDEVAAQSGFDEALRTQVRARTDSRMYGMVLGACVPGVGATAVCALPELGITYHALKGASFRNGVRFRYADSARPHLVAIGRRLLDPNGEASTPFAAARIPVRWFNGSSPGVLWHIFDGNCTGYANLSCGFDVQFAAIVAQSAGLLVTDRSGRSLSPPSAETIESVVFASSTEEKDEICGVMQQFP